jgi:hypothetical protein
VGRVSGGMYKKITGFGKIYKCITIGLCGI